MSRLSFLCLVPALLAASLLTAHAQTAVDSVVRTTVTTTITTTTVTKPAAPGARPVVMATSSSTTTTSSSTPAATSAPAVPAAPARQPAPGDLTGARPAAAPARPASAATTAAKPKTAAARATTPAARAAAASAGRRPAAAAAADPELSRMLRTNVDLTKVRAEDLPGLYEQFLETTRAERRRWTAAKWKTAGDVLSRLNQRYEQVRGELSLEEKLTIRTLQGEFRALEAAKQVSKSL